MYNRHLMYESFFNLIYLIDFLFRKNDDWYYELFASSWILVSEVFHSVLVLRIRNEQFKFWSNNNNNILSILFKCWVSNITNVIKLNSDTYSKIILNLICDHVNNRLLLSQTLLLIEWKTENCLFFLFLGNLRESILWLIMP